MALFQSHWLTALFLSPLIWMAYDLKVNGLPRVGRSSRGAEPAERLEALAPRIGEVRDLWYSNKPGSGVRFISKVISLAPHLEALDIPCPPEPPTVNDTHDWEDFLSRLLPLAEQGRDEDARCLLATRP